MMRKLLRVVIFDIFIILLLMAAGMVLFSSTTGPLAGHRKNKRGADYIMGEQYEMAEKFFLDALTTEPDAFEPRVNLGITYELLEKPDRAYKEYAAILRRTDLTVEKSFVGQFNAGNASSQQQKIEDALKHYQAALDLVPGEENVRKNIELLFLGMQGKGKGKGSGNSDEKNDEQNEGEGQEPKDNPSQSENENEQKKEQEKDKFDGKNLTQDDVRKILEELKSQEQKIRALDYSGKRGKEQAPGKDW